MNAALIVVTCSLLLIGCSRSKAKPEPASTNEPPTSGNPITAPVDYLGAVAKGRRTAIRTIDLVSVNQAVQLFNAQEGRFPKDLEELVTEKYLAAIPAAPTGMRLHYDAARGEATMVRVTSP